VNVLLDLAKAAVRTVVAVPIAAVADIVTLGGVCTGRGETYTSEQIRKVAEKFEDAVE